jgi:hypothetical protein
MRELKPAELQAFAERAAHYVELAQEYLALLEARP